LQTVTLHKILLTMGKNDKKGKTAKAMTAAKQEEPVEEPVEEPEAIKEEEALVKDESSTDILTAKTFRDLGVCDTLAEACERLEWKTATRIQAEVLEEALAGRDIIGLAETGSGTWTRNECNGVVLWRGVA